MGRVNIVEIPSMTSDDVRPFVEGIISYVKNPKVDVQDLLKSYASEIEDENIQEETYPFTDEALEALKSACGQLIVPREICYLLGRGAAYAKIRQRHVVSRKDLESASVGATD